MKIKVSVPATSANVGSGFDALGLAVTLYNTVTFEESDHLEISSADGTRIPRNESNLVYRSAKGLFDKVGKTIPPLKIVQTNPIPMARGLGSSSACIIAGLLGANRMLGDVLNTQELLTLATSIEGHPDNVAPALLGGLTSSVFEDGKVYSVKRNVDETLCFAAIVPDYKLLTEAARAALPKEVSHRDAVYNLSRAALVPAAFCEGRHDLLAIATEDKLHQPYRMPLMPGSKEVFDMARLCGAKAVYVSGAGSTVMAVAEKAEAEKFYSKLEKGLELLEGLDGVRKMSKSYGNYIGINEPAADQFGKAMSVSDDLMWRYYELISSKSLDEIAALKKDVEEGRLHPKKAKEALAYEIVARYHGEEQAQEALQGFNSVFADGGIPDDAPEFACEHGEASKPPVFLTDSGLAASRGEAKRLIKQGSLSLDGERCDDAESPLEPGSYVVKLGKKRFLRLTVR